MKSSLRQIMKNFKNTKVGSFAWNVCVFLRQKLFYPTHFRILIRDLLRLPYLRLNDTHKFSGANFLHILHFKESGLLQKPLYDKSGWLLRYYEDGLY